MIYQVSSIAIFIFIFFVAVVLGLSFFFARKSKSASGYYAAGGQIHWAVNGIAFAGDYLSAASFLGICGMIAFFGYDGFLYSIGYLAGWVVALFLVAEPLKRLGKYTFADALDAKFNSRGIKLTAAISTLVVSIFYLIPQMVGAGAIVTPLLGLPHWIGVVMVGSIVILIVATAGMTSTTYVQFIKGGLLIVFSLALVVMVLNKGIKRTPGAGYHKPAGPGGDSQRRPGDGGRRRILPGPGASTRKADITFVKMAKRRDRLLVEIECRRNEPGTGGNAVGGGDPGAATPCTTAKPKEAGKFYQVGHVQQGHRRRQRSGRDRTHRSLQIHQDTGVFANRPLQQESL